MPGAECFVASCVTGRKKQSGHLFCFPKNGDEALKAAWLDTIPTRERPFDFENDAVCHLHFAKEQLDTSWNQKIGDKIVQKPRQRWRLVEGAVPTVFPDSPKESPKSPVKQKTKEVDESGPGESEGGESSMLPPGYLRMLADACKLRAKRQAEDLPEENAKKSQKLDNEVSMLPPGYLRMLSNVCVEQEQSTSNTKAPRAKSPTVYFVLPDSPTICELRLESSTSPPPEVEAEPEPEPPPSRSPVPSSTSDESMPVITELRSERQESEAETLTAVESVVTVTSEMASGFDLETISNQLSADGLMSDAWTCNVLKDWQGSEMVLSCAELVTTHCGAEVQKSIMISSEGITTIYIRHVDVTPEFASFTCFNYSDVKALLRSVKQAKLCAGLSNCDSVDEFCGGLAINNVWFSENCLQIVSPTERQCRKCKALWSSLENEPSTTKLKSTEPKPSAMTGEEARDRLRATLRDQSYLKQRLNRVKKTNASLLEEVKGLRAESDAKLSKVESGLEITGLPEKQKLAFTTAVQAAKRSSRCTPYSAEWLLECNGILRQSNKAYEHLRTRNILPLPTKKHLRKLLKNIPLASAAAPASIQNAPIAMAGQVSAVAVAEDGTMTTIVLDEVQMQQLLSANGVIGVEMEELVVTGQNQDHEYSLT